MPLPKMPFVCVALRVLGWVEITFGVMLALFLGMGSAHLRTLMPDVGISPLLAGTMDTLIGLTLSVGLFIHGRHR